MVTLPHLSCLGSGSSPQQADQPLPFIVAQRLDALRLIMGDALFLPMRATLDSTRWDSRLALVMGAALKRSLEVLEGFAHAVERRHSQAALVLLRSQLDTAMRFHGLWAAAEPEEYLEALIAGNVRNLKSRGGERLTDAVLHRELSAHYPGLSADYGELSGVVHLSSFALASQVDSYDPASGWGLFLDPGGWANSGACAATAAFGLYAGAIAHMFSIIAMSAEAGEIDAVFTSDASFSSTDLPSWLSAFVCHA